MRMSFRISAGIVLCLLGILGCIYSIRVARAQKLYYSVKYGSLTTADPYVIKTACDEAYNLYPHNYNLCNQASSTLWSLITASEADKRESAINLVELWSKRGLIANPYCLALRYRKAELLSLSSANEAADYWKEFTDT